MVKWNAMSCGTHSDNCPAPLQDARFDQIVGVIEDTMMDPTFQGPQEEFCRANCGVYGAVGQLVEDVGLCRGKASDAAAGARPTQCTHRRRVR